jgi:hypothetical protein
MQAASKVKLASFFMQCVLIALRAMLFDLKTIRIISAIFARDVTAF